ncbi:hypothetical protein [uncultured Roseivirga sp.]|uniref:hypothetical protein n=1 Tax=uncultured Roseivirga sp. TaxID=543088 RepID=UPI0025842BC0|nr:hypothetical protein [uncultured Roseivirga sp.]
MKHTRCLFVFIFSLMMVSGAVHAQSISFSNDNGIKTSSGELQSSNSKLFKELKKLKKKGRKELSTQYPAASEEELDSLIAMRKAQLEENLKDSTESQLSKIRKQMVEDLSETPEKLPVSDEIKESIEELKELEAMELLQKDSLKAKDIFTDQNIRKVHKRSGALLDDLHEYKSHFKDWDKTLLSQVESIPEAQMAKEQVEKMKAYKPLPDDYRQNMDKFQTNDFVKEQLESKAEELEKIGESLQDRFDDAMLKMQEAKEKFPSLESLEETPKRYNPYRDEPFFKRLQYGGNISYVPQKPVSLDLALNVIYPVNKRISLGVETAGRIKLEKTNPTIQSQLNSQNQWSIRGVSRYQLKSAFYAQANYEASRTTILNTQDNTTAHGWYRTMLVGLGRRFTIREKIKLNITTFYDLFYNPQMSPNNSAWIVRLGFDVYPN